MLPFPVTFRTGIPPSEDIVYSVRRACASGILAPGDRFPSVRVLSRECRVHPNTAHKAVAALIAEGTLEVQPGIGTRIAQPTQASASAKRALLRDEVERLIVGARRLGIRQEDLLDAIRRVWDRLEP